MKRLLFIYNPHAGKELLKPQLSDIIDIFVKAGYEVTAYPTQSYRDAYKKVLKYNAKDYDLVVCSGGDGTIDFRKMKISRLFSCLFLVHSHSHKGVAIKFFRKGGRP